MDNLASNLKFYTVKDFLEWEGEERIEIINGVLYYLNTPLVEHQMISSNLFGAFWDYLKGKSCKVFTSPIGVQPIESDDSSVVQPDLLVVCDSNKIKKHLIVGAPDLVIEILSRSSLKMDKVLKYDLYSRAGVKEYWIVDPVSRLIDKHCLNEKGLLYPVGCYGFEDTLDSTLFKDLQIPLKRVFDRKDDDIGGPN